MWKQLLLVFAIWHGAQCDDDDHEDDTVVQFPFGSDLSVLNYTQPGGPTKPPIVNMHGHNNYHAAQQIFYIYGPALWKQQADNNRADKAAASEYLVTPGLGAHKLHTRSLTWNKARRVCIEEGGHMAIINSLSEEKVLLRLMDEKKIDAAWLGVHDMFEEGDWVTLKDEALENSGYSRWTTKYANQPDNHGGKQNCGCLLKEGGMDDTNCDNTLSFFCEISL